MANYAHPLPYYAMHSYSGQYYASYLDSLCIRMHSILFWQTLIFVTVLLTQVTQSRCDCPGKTRQCLERRFTYYQNL